MFLNHERGQSPEDELLLQMQGMIAEYERAQILERSRRGKRHKAQQGLVCVLGAAPYGYRYVTMAEGGGEARYDIVEEQAQVVRQMFEWIGRERVSLGEVQRRLAAAGIAPVQGKTPWWERSVIWALVTNPAYRGQAAFGKTRADELRPRRREHRGRPRQPRRARTVVDVPPEQWLPIPVPALVSDELFAAVQTQLEENRRRAREGQRGANYLLQGLLVCACCGYSYYGKPISASASKGRTRYSYYRCIGSDAYRFGGQRVCDNKTVRTDQLEAVVWQAVRQLLEEPSRLAAEYQRRLDAVQVSPGEADTVLIEKQIAKIRQGITRLIDGYAEGYLDKAEVEPRIRRFKQRLQTLEQQAEQHRDRAQQQTDLQLVIGQLEAFSAKVRNGLEQCDWHGCRELIRTLVKCIEIDRERINVVFRVEESTFPEGNDPFLQHCKRRRSAYSRGYAKLPI